MPRETSLKPSISGLPVEECGGPDRSIRRLGTALAAFVGRTLRGPVNDPVLITSFAQFQQLFGGLWQPSPLSYAVEHFFDNGGCEAYIVRVINGATAATLVLGAGAQAMTLRAVRPGTREFLRASVDYDNIPASCVAEFNLVLQRVRLLGTEQVEDQEIFAKVSVLPEAPRFIGKLLNGSALVRLLGSAPDERPDRTAHSLAGAAAGYISSNADGDDGAPLTDYDVIGSRQERSGLFALERVQYFNLLCIPPLSRDRDVGASLLLIAARYCKAHRALLIADPPTDWHTADEALQGLRQWWFCSESAIMYFPRVLAHDKLRGHFETFGSSGAVAGMLARADAASPVWGPVESDEGVLRPGYRPACLVTEDRRARLAARGVNTIQAVRSVARAGQQMRTLASGSAMTLDWQYLRATRLALFIVNCIERGTRWVVHSKPQREAARLAIVQVTAFFEWLRSEGAFGDRPPEDCYLVVCDQRARTRELEQDEFQLLIGFAAQRGGEFHCFRISQAPSGSSVVALSHNRAAAGRLAPLEPAWVGEPTQRLRPVS